MKIGLMPVITKDIAQEILLWWYNVTIEVNVIVFAQFITSLPLLLLEVENIQPCISSTNLS